MNTIFTMIKRSPSLLIALIIMVGSYTMQLFGNVDVGLLGRPYNLILLIVLLVILFCFKVFLNHSMVVQWLSSPKGLISSFSLFLIQIVILGFFPQNHLQDIESASPWGINSVLTSWPWAITQLFLFITLGFSIIDSLLKRTSRQFLLLNSGFWIVLAGTQLGYGDVAFISVPINIGSTTNSGFNRNGEKVDLGCSITLSEFHIEDYQPNLVLINTKTGIALSNSAKDLILCEKGNSHTLAGYEITVNTYHPFAVKYGEMFRSENDLFSVHAAHIDVRDTDTENVRSGWVSSGNSEMSPYGFPVNDSLILLVEPPRIKEFRSEVVLEQGETIDSLSIEVNRPVKFGKWKVYQKGYNKSMGRWSQVSEFQFVTDPWLPFVYIGIFMMIGGALYIVYTGKREE